MALPQTRSRRRRRQRRRDVTPYYVIYLWHVAENRGRTIMKDPPRRLHETDSRQWFAIGTTLTIRHQGRGVNRGRDAGYLRHPGRTWRRGSSRPRVNRSARSHRELRSLRKRSTRLLLSRLYDSGLSVNYPFDRTRPVYRRDHGTSPSPSDPLRDIPVEQITRTTGAPAQWRTVRKTISPGIDFEWSRRLTNGWMGKGGRGRGRN